MTNIALHEKPSRYSQYVSELSEDIAHTIETLGSQPILFIGSGLSKRYMGAPSWDELLTLLAEQCSSIDKAYPFYKQSLPNQIEIAEEFARLYQEWAWGAGYGQFPKSLFSDGLPAQIYLKHAAAQILQKLTPKSLIALSNGPFSDELAALKQIKPHAVITTNFDQLLELIFPDHFPIIGQQILKGSQVSVGELYKIHGCVTDPSSLVFTATDYEVFAKRKKYLSAKLLTYFSEHPLLFIGYSASDPNIKAILSDIDEVLSEKGGVIPNVYILEWRPNIDSGETPARDRLIGTENGNSVRVKLIEANDLKWVFDAFASRPSLNDVSPRVLRSLIARSYNLVRYDIPRMTVQADFKMLTESVEDADKFGRLFGIANIENGSVQSAQYPLSATQLGRKLGGGSWHTAHRLILRIKDEKGVDIKAFDNLYHRAEKLNKTVFHKYSDEALELLKKVKSGAAYALKI